MSQDGIIYERADLVDYCVLYGGSMDYREFKQMWIMTNLLVIRLVGDRGLVDYRRLSWITGLSWTIVD